MAPRIKNRAKPVPAAAVIPVVQVMINIGLKTWEVGFNLSVLKSHEKHVMLCEILSNFSFYVHLSSM